MRVKRNMKRSLKNSTRHLTGAIKIITLTLIIITLYTKSTSALTYQDSVDVSFTFDPTLSISLSSSNISIDSLSPGNYAHSNTVAINVSTNNVYGYTLTAKVGDDGGASGTSAGSNLVNTSTSTSFTSLSTNDNLTLSSFSPNTWGYTTSSNINNSTTTYSGLLYNIDTTLNVTTSNAGKSIAGYPGTNTTNFTIGASAATDQLAGDYTNIISFTVVTNIINDFTINNLKYMQDFANLIPSEMEEVLNSITEGTTYVLHDSRDEQEYTIAKLADGKIWMTKNLNLAGGTALTYNDTDFEPIYNLPTTQGWQSGGRLPVSQTITSGTGLNGGFYINNYAYVFNSGNTVCSASSPCYSYYSWDAATLGSGRNIATDNQSAPYSLCPKGWRLPTTYNGSGTAAGATDFRALITAMDGSNFMKIYDSSTSPTGTTLYNALIGQPYNFSLSGRYSQAQFLYGGAVGLYWTATSSSANGTSRNIEFYDGRLALAQSNGRALGYPIRCILSQ